MQRLIGQEKILTRGELTKGDLRKERKTEERRKEKIEKKEKDFMKFCLKNDTFYKEERTSKLLFQNSTRRLYQVMNNSKLIDRKNFRTLKRPE